MMLSTNPMNLSASELRRMFLDNLRRQAVRQAPPGETFQLASGGTSSWLVNVKDALDPTSLVLASRLLNREIYTHFPTVTYLGGVATGGIPLVYATSLMSRFEGTGGLPAFYVRSEPKNHGTRNKIEGDFEPQHPSLVIDDVCSQGISVERAIDAILDAGGSVGGVLVVVDRDEGAKQRFADRGVKYRYLYTRQDLIPA